MYRVRGLLILLAVIFFSPVVVSAQETDPATGEFIQDPNDPGVVYRKKTEYDFEDDVVEGSFVRPEGEYLDSRRRARHSSLIRIRENFVPEMLKSAEDI
jgi:hypothetical protein